MSYIFLLSDRSRTGLAGHAWRDDFPHRPPPGCRPTLCHLLIVHVRIIHLHILHATIAANFPFLKVQPATIAHLAMRWPFGDAWSSIGALVPYLWGGTRSFQKYIAICLIPLSTRLEARVYLPSLVDSWMQEVRFACGGISFWVCWRAGLLCLLFTARTSLIKSVTDFYFLLFLV